MVDDEGKCKAVLIDLAEHGELCGDIYDALLAREREIEPRESLAEVKQRLSAKRA